MDSPPLGEMLRLYRVTRRLTLRQLAPEIGIGHATLMRIESGKAFDANTMLKLWMWMLQLDHVTSPVVTEDE